MVEKPLGLPGEEVEFRELHKQHPQRIYAADFSNGTDSLNYALKSGIFSEIGKVRSIIGRFVEEQSIEDLINAVRDRKLLKTHCSGGGLGFDMGVHSLVTQERILGEVYNSSLRNAELKDVFLGAVDHPEIEANRDPENETYWRSHVVLDNGINVYNDAGKGLDDHDYIVQVQGEKGDLVISSGTRKNKPFVLLNKRDGEPRLFVFPDGVGYRGIFEDFVLTALGKHDLVKPNLDGLMNTASTAVELVGKTYRHARELGQGVQKIPFGKTPDLNGSARPGDPFLASSRVVAQQLAQV